tara:strand:+ start:24 stop:1040 length:1017 start_codon:yes stop_codon:yes gene_type:complete
MSDKKILLLFTNHRVAEKLWPIIPELAKEYTLDLFLVGLHSFNTPWVGDIDERKITVDKYQFYLNNIIVGPGIQFHGDNIKEDLTSFINLDDYSLVIYDDDREMYEFNIPSFYQECKLKDIKVIGNSHGNEDIPHNALTKSYDYQMDFTTGGIPANDTLKNIKCNQNHILIIANFLGNRSSIYPLNLDSTFIQECGALELSKEYNLPIKVKIKTRLDNPDYTSSINYVKNILDCEVITNTNNIDQLIADSAVVISAPSTLAFKSIQLGIPTVLIKGSGAVGKFSSYPGLVNLDKQEIFNNLQMQINRGKFTNFIENTIMGGVDFNSSEVYVKYLKEII